MSPKRSPLRFLVAVFLLWGCFVFPGSECEFLYPGGSDDTGYQNLGQKLFDLEEQMKAKLIEVIEESAYHYLDVMPQISIDVNCESAILKFFRGILNLHEWAVQMIDASAKPPAGILEGSAVALGDYDECLEAPQRMDEKLTSEDDLVEPVPSQYCMVKLDLPDLLRKAAMDYQAGNRSNSYLAKTSTVLRTLMKVAPRADIADMRLGVCMPAACTIEDMEHIITSIAGGPVEMLTILRCETNERAELQVEQIVILAILGLITFLVLIGTLLDTVLRVMASGPVDDVFYNKQNTYVRFLVSFSLYNNFKKLTKLEVDDGQLSSVRGIRSLSVILVIVVSTYAMPIDLHFLKYRGAFNFFKFMDQWWFSGIANSSVGVDSLFFLAGLQITYRMWRKAVKDSEGKVSFNILKFIVVWYVRLTAAQLLVIALFLLFPVIGSGPIWGDVVIPEVEHCKTTWWMNVLYINNLWPANETCLYHTWFVTALMQMLVVTPFILWILNRSKGFGIILLMAIIMGSCIAVGMITADKDLPPTAAVYFLSFLNLRWVWDKLFIQAYDHVASFCVGILTGYIIARNPKFELRKITVIFGWCGAISCNLAIMFGLYSYRHGEVMDQSLAAFYAATHRFAWALGIAWIVFSCAYGYGGVVGEFLSSKIFIPLDRLSIFIYLLHPLVIFFHGGQIREKLYLSHLDVAVYSLGYIVITCFLSALCYVVFTLPYKFLESAAWKTREGNVNQNHVTVSKVIAIKERITNEFNLTMRDSPGNLISENEIGGVDNHAFRA